MAGSVSGVSQVSDAGLGVRFQRSRRCWRVSPKVELPAAASGFVLAMRRPVHRRGETGSGCSGDWDCHRFGGFYLRDEIFPARI